MDDLSIMNHDGHSVVPVLGSAPKQATPFSVYSDATAVEKEYPLGMMQACGAN